MQDGWSGSHDHGGAPGLPLLHPHTPKRWTLVPSWFNYYGGLLAAELKGGTVSHLPPGVSEPGTSKNVPRQQLCYRKERDGALPTVERAVLGGRGGRMPRTPGQREEAEQGFLLEKTRKQNKTRRT